mgnify:FL=1
MSIDKGYMAVRLNARPPGEFIRDHLLSVGGVDFVQSIFNAYKMHLRSAGIKNLASRAALSNYIWLCNKMGLVVFDHASAVDHWDGMQDGMEPPATYVRESRPQAPSPRHYYRLVNAADPRWINLQASYRESIGLPRVAPRKPRVKPVEAPPPVEVAPPRRRPGRPPKPRVEAAPPAKVPAVPEAREREEMESLVSQIQTVLDESNRAPTLKKLKILMAQLNEDMVEGVEDIEAAIEEYEGIQREGLTPEEYRDERETAFQDIQDATQGLALIEKEEEVVPAPPKARKVTVKVPAAPKPEPVKVPPIRTPETASLQKRYEELRSEAAAVVANPTIETTVALKEKILALHTEVRDAERGVRGKERLLLGDIVSSLIHGIEDSETLEGNLRLIALAEKVKRLEQMSRDMRARATAQDNPLVVQHEITTTLAIANQLGPPVPKEALTLIARGLDSPWARRLQEDSRRTSANLGNIARILLDNLKPS